MTNGLDRIFPKFLKSCVSYRIIVERAMLNCSICSLDQLTKYFTITTTSMGLKVLNFVLQTVNPHFSDLLHGLEILLIFVAFQVGSCNK